MTKYSTFCFRYHIWVSESICDCESSSLLHRGRSEAGRRLVEAGHRRPQHGGPVASTTKHKRNHTDETSLASWDWQTVYCLDRVRRQDIFTQSFSFSFTTCHSFCYCRVVVLVHFCSTVYTPVWLVVFNSMKNLVSSAAAILLSWGDECSWKKKN